MSVAGIGNTIATATKTAHDQAGELGQERLFEVMADNAHHQAGANGTTNLTQTFMDHMRGFVERNHDLGEIDLDQGMHAHRSAMQAHKIDDIPASFEPDGQAQDPHVAGGAQESTSENMDVALRSLDALKDSYSRAIEIGLVSRGATQASGAVRSLLRGQ